MTELFCTLCIIFNFSTEKKTNFDFAVVTNPPPNYLSYDVSVEVKSEDYHNCSVLHALSMTIVHNDTHT